MRPYRGSREAPAKGEGRVPGGTGNGTRRLLGAANAV
jgi:hypothetical protein